jgi:hypothetical protein
VKCQTLTRSDRHLLPCPRTHRKETTSEIRLQLLINIKTEVNEPLNRNTNFID